MQKTTLFPLAIFWKNKGFTLIEIVIVMVIAGLIMDVISRALVIPLRVFSSHRERGELIYRANLIMQRLNAEMSNAVSASVRVTTSGTSSALEYLNTLDVRRYHGVAEDPSTTGITFASQTTPSFNIWGPFPTTLTSGTNYTGNYQSLSMVIGNVLFDQISGDQALSVYTSGNETTGITPGRVNTMSSSVITPKASLATRAVWQILTPDGSSTSFPQDGRVIFNYALDSVSNPTFPVAAPLHNQWVYTTDGAVSYVCDMATTPGTLRRYSGYEIRATQPIAAADFAGTGTAAYLWRSDAPIVQTVLADNLSACSISYLNKMVILDVTLALNGQSLRILDQIYAAQ